jgi:nucleoside-triphosphatase THEP1
MLKPSEEQMKIIDAVKDGFNVQVDAVAGSGKTTTVLSLAHHLNEKRIMQVTYNSELKLEVREKQLKYMSEFDMQLGNLSIYTYHALGYKYYCDEAKTDIGLSKIVELNMRSRGSISLPQIDIIVVDEIQDMNELYFRFIIKFLRDVLTDCTEVIQLITLGDKYQGLYDFKGADTRYLTYSSKIWKIWQVDNPFKILQLTTSYRITKQIALFVNKVMLGEKRLIAIKNGPPVLYIRHPDAFQNFKIIGFRIIEMIRSGYARPADIFVLAPSVKSENSPIKLIENMLVNNNIPCFVPMTETSSISSEIIKNKVIFSSFHQSKGRERKVVVVYGFDDSYFAFFNKDSPPHVCPSTLYVAATRATEQLILVESSKPLPFLKYSHWDLIDDSCAFTHFVGDPLSIVESERPKSPENIRFSSPTDLIKFLDENVMIKIMKLIESVDLFTTDNLSFPFQEVKMVGVVDTKYHDVNLSEEVFDINGLVIPAIFEEKWSNVGVIGLGVGLGVGLGFGTIKQFVYNRMGNDNNSQKIYQSVLSGVNFEKSSVEDYLRIVNVYISMKEKLNFKVMQINNYKWLSEIDVNKLMMNMSRHIKNPGELQYEVPIIKRGDEELHLNIDIFVKKCMDNDNDNKKFGKIRFTAIVDALSPFISWEFKCTDELEPEHLLQVIIYAWIWKMSNESMLGIRTFKLMNIKSAEVVTLNYINNELVVDKIIEMILISKYTKLVKKTDKEFIDNCIMITTA